MAFKQGSITVVPAPTAITRGSELTSKGASADTFWAYPGSQVAGATWATRTFLHMVISQEDIKDRILGDHLTKLGMQMM